MADVIITMKIMPDSPEVSLEELETKITKLITGYGGEVGKKEIEPIAFGLKALILIFVSDESKGSTEELEKQISEIEGVTSIEITDVRRALG